MRGVWGGAAPPSKWGVWVRPPRTVMPISVPPGGYLCPTDSTTGIRISLIQYTIQISVFRCSHPHTGEPWSTVERAGIASKRLRRVQMLDTISNIPRLLLVSQENGVWQSFRKMLGIILILVNWEGNTTLIWSHSMCQQNGPLTAIYSHFLQYI